jgi:hypothetical protein
MGFNIVTEWADKENQNDYSQLHSQGAQEVPNLNKTHPDQGRHLDNENEVATEMT